MAVQKIIGTVNGWIWLGLYHTAQALEIVFMAVLQLFGMFSPKRLENGDIVENVFRIFSRGFAGRLS
ncbi:hypothetical protein EFP05_16820 [Lactiplantibacillus pentosus]|nr:hypothetical protein [Lactiplantibacillus pentosus]